MRTLSHGEARRAYDWIGRIQDWQAFYEDDATASLAGHADFGTAAAVFEFGCGTGRFARRLLDEHLSATATYRGVDVSPRMVGLARRRLEPYAGRATVVLTEGDPPTGEPAAAYDRFVSNFVFDLLSENDIRAVLDEAHRMLRPGGLLCLSGLSTEEGRPPGRVMRVWGWIHSVAPSLVGGCRSVDLLPFLSSDRWQVLHHVKLVRCGMPSEVVVAARRDMPSGSSRP